MNLKYILILAGIINACGLYAQENGDYLAQAQTHASAALQDTKNATSELGLAFGNTAQAAGQAAKSAIAPVVATVRPAITQAQNTLENAFTTTNAVTTAPSNATNTSSIAGTTPSATTAQTNGIESTTAQAEKPLATRISEGLNTVAQINMPATDSTSTANATGIQEDNEEPTLEGIEIIETSPNGEGYFEIDVE